MSRGRHASKSNTTAPGTKERPARSGEVPEGHHYRAWAHSQSTLPFWVAIGLLGVAAAGQGYFLSAAWDFWHVALDLMELYLRLADIHIT